MSKIQNQYNSYKELNAENPQFSAPESSAELPPTSASKKIKTAPNLAKPMTKNSYIKSTARGRKLSSKKLDARANISSKTKTTSQSKYQLALLANPLKADPRAAGEQPSSTTQTSQTSKIPSSHKNKSNNKKNYNLKIMFFQQQQMF